MFVFGVFSISFVTCHKKIEYLFQYCLWRWVDMTKIWFVCRTESLRQTHFLFVALRHCDKQNMYMLGKKCQIVPKIWKMNTKKSQKMPKRHQKCYKLQKVKISAAFLALFSIFPAMFPNLVCHCDSLQQTKNQFVAVTQCDKQNKSLSQWLSAIKNIEKNIQFLCGMWQRNWKKSQKQTSFHIWISPPLSNCFGVPFSLNLPAVFISLRSQWNFIDLHIFLW